MPFDVLGKVLFPREQRSERSRKAKTVVGVIFMALVLGRCLGVIFYFQNSHH